MMVAKCWKNAAADENHSCTMHRNDLDSKSTCGMSTYDRLGKMLRGDEAVSARFQIPMAA